MATLGIIAEFNPLHKGHEYLISKARQQGTVVAVMSGNFVQRGETAIAEKRLRAQAALCCGVDLVLELPALWSMSTAECFALGGVEILKNIGCEKIIFGSECGNIASLQNTAELLLTEDFSRSVAEKLKNGDTFAAAREAAATQCGLEGDLLSKPNNNLAVEYIKASKKQGYRFEFETVKRIGAQHDSSIEDKFVSASLLREKLSQGDYDFCQKYMSNAALSLFTPDTLSDINRLDRAILAMLRTKSLKELQNLPDISEGIENKLYNEIKVAESLDDLYNRVKVKRYTLARIRRLALWAFIGADSSFFMKSPPYIRVLGFNSKGEQQLRLAAANSKIPVITRWADIKNLGTDALKVYETECRATDLFNLSLPKPQPCGLEYTAKIIKTE